MPYPPSACRRAQTLRPDPSAPIPCSGFDIDGCEKQMASCNGELESLDTTKLLTKLLGSYPEFAHPEPKVSERLYIF